MSVLGLSGLPVSQAGQACLTAAALGAREAVEEILPTEVFDGLDAEARVSASRSIAGSSPRGWSLRSAVLKKSVAMWRCFRRRAGR